MRSIDVLFAKRMLEGNNPDRPFTVVFCDGIEMRATINALLSLGCKVNTPAFGLRVSVTPPMVVTANDENSKEKR